MAAKRKANGEGTIRRRDDGRWEARITIGDKRKSIYGKTKTEVRNKMIEIQMDVLDNSFVNESSITVKTWLNTWLNDFMGNVKFSTLRSYNTYVKIHILPAIGHVKLKDLTAIHIQKMYNDLRKKGLATATIQVIHCIVHGSLKKAVEIKYLKHNPSNGCVIPQVINRNKMFLADENIKKFLNAIKGDPYEDAFYFDMFTGLRKSELCGLTWDCVDFKNGTVRIYRQLQKVGVVNGRSTFEFTCLKNKKERVVKPAPQIMERLKNIKKRQLENKLKYGRYFSNENEFVFTNELGTPCHFHTMYFHLKKIAADIGMPELRFHDLRHTFATLSIQGGIDIKTVSSSLGHATTAFTMDVYGHVSNEMLNQSSEKMAQVINNLAI